MNARLWQHHYCAGKEAKRGNRPQLCLGLELFSAGLTPVNSSGTTGSLQRGYQGGRGREGKLHVNLCEATGIIARQVKCIFSFVRWLVVCQTELL